ncbi:MAG: hypothetical protein H6581_04545 [Bacteroidia bacterium]|nr:hypothetical protein [Bacteroidia bacterium]
MTKESPQIITGFVKSGFSFLVIFIFFITQGCEPSLKEFDSEDGKISKSSSFGRIEIAEKSDEGTISFKIPKENLAQYLQRYTNFDDPISIRIDPSTINIKKLAIVLKTKDQYYLSGEGYDYNQKQAIFSRVLLEENDNLFFLKNINSKSALDKLTRDVSYCNSSNPELNCSGFEEIEGEYGLTIKCTEGCDHTLISFDGTEAKNN